jgi:hypothetical protein
MSPQLKERTIVRSGTVESKVRTLVSKLETIESLHLANPFVKGFEQTYFVKDAAESSAVSRGEVTDEIAKRTKDDIAGVEGAFEVFTTNFYIGLSIQQKPKGAFISYTKRADWGIAYGKSQTKPTREMTMTGESRTKRLAQARSDVPDYRVLQDGQAVGHLRRKRHGDSRPIPERVRQILFLSSCVSPIERYLRLWPILFGLLMRRAPVMGEGKKTGRSCLTLFSQTASDRHPRRLSGLNLQRCAPLPHAPSCCSFPFALDHSFLFVYREPTMTANRRAVTPTAARLQPRLRRKRRPGQQEQERAVTAAASKKAQHRR